MVDTKMIQTAAHVEQPSTPGRGDKSGSSRYCGGGGPRERERTPTTITATTATTPTTPTTPTTTATTATMPAIVIVTMREVMITNGVKHDLFV